MSPRRGYDEPNYTMVPNLLFDVHLCALGLAELKVLLVVCRDTIGWHRKETEPLSLSKLQKRTDLGRAAVSTATQSLLDKGLIRRRRKGESYVYELAISDQLTLAGGGSVVELGGSIGEPPGRSDDQTTASSVGEPEPVRQSNPSKRKGNKAPKETPSSPPEGGERERLDQVFEQLLERCEAEGMNLAHAFIRASRLVSIEGDVATIALGRGIEPGYLLKMCGGWLVDELGVDRLALESEPAPRRRRRQAAA